MILGASPGVIPRKSSKWNYNQIENENETQTKVPLESVLKDAYEKCVANQPDHFVNFPENKVTKLMKLPDGLQKKMKLESLTLRAVSTVFGEKFAKLRSMSVC